MHCFFLAPFFHHLIAFSSHFLDQTFIKHLFDKTPIYTYYSFRCKCVAYNEVRYMKLYINLNYICVKWSVFCVCAFYSFSGEKLSNIDNNDKIIDHTHAKCCNWHKKENNFLEIHWNIEIHFALSTTIQYKRKFSVHWNTEVSSNLLSVMVEHHTKFNARI